MAKIAFGKLDLKICDEIKNIVYVNNKLEEIEIEIKTYLPINEKIDMISRIINWSLDDNGFYNPIRVKIFTALEIMYSYTNLTFTAKQKENVFKLYDLIVSSGLYDSVIEQIGQKELDEINNTVVIAIEGIYKHKNSVMGVIETLAQDYDNVNMDLTAIQEKLADPNALTLIKEIIPFDNP
jgi:hypothetical protein